MSEPLNEQVRMRLKLTDDGIEQEILEEAEASVSTPTGKVIKDNTLTVTARAQSDGLVFLLVEDIKGQYVFTQRLDDADDWAVFSETGSASITERKIGPFAIAHLLAAPSPDSVAGAKADVPQLLSDTYERVRAVGYAEGLKDAIGVVRRYRPHEVPDEYVSMCAEIEVEIETLIPKRVANSNRGYAEGLAPWIECSAAAIRSLRPTTQMAEWPPETQLKQITEADYEEGRKAAQRAVTEHQQGAYPTTGRYKFYCVPCARAFSSDEKLAAHECVED